MKVRKVLYVQPVQSPYLTPRLEALASDPELDIILVLERSQFDHRPGWNPINVKGCSIEVMSSKVVGVTWRYDDLGYKVHGIRVVPWQLPYVIWRHRPDIVIVCNATELLLATMARAFLGFKILINVEDTLHATRNKSFIGRSLKAWAYRKADIHLAFSEMAVEYLSSIGINDSIRRTSWSLNLAAFERKGSVRKDKRSDLKLENRLTFLFAGMLIQQKGIMQMLKAWAGMNPEFRAQSSLVIVGDGPLRAESHAFVKDNNISEVIFAGRVPYSSMPDYYAAADVFILPTLQDLFSLVVVEAMASGCAIMTTPYNGASELVKEGENGWLFDSSVESDFRKALYTAFESWQRISAMGRLAQGDIQPLGTARVMKELSTILKNA